MLNTSAAPIDFIAQSSQGVEIELKDVSWGHSSMNPVLQNLNLCIPRGRLTSVLGPSGCGKSSLLRLVAGLETPDAGQILMDGRDVTTFGPAQRNIGMVVQAYALFPHLNVIENVAYGPKMQGVSHTQAHSLAREVLAVVDLLGVEDRLPNTLSGGQQQRVALARALAHQPDVLLLDEPLSNLDSGLRRQVREHIRALQQKLNLTVVYVTHDQAEAMAVSDQMIVMSEGRVLQCGSPWELYRAPLNQAVATLMSDVTYLQATVAEGFRLVVSGHAISGIETLCHSPGKELMLRVCPEAWRLSPADNKGIPARIVGCAYQGRTTEYVLAVGWGDLRVTVWGETSFLQIGSPVSLNLQTTGVCLLDACKESVTLIGVH